MSPATTSDPVVTKRRDSYAFVAFWVAVMLIVFDFGGVLAVLYASGRRGGFLVMAAACFLAVFVPWLISVYRHVREPGEWGGKGYLIATAVVLALMLAGIGITVINLFVK